MTLRLRLSATDCVVISGVQHRVRSQDASGIILERVDDATVTQSCSHDEFVKLLAAPDVAFLRAHFAQQAATLRLRCDTRYLATLPRVKQAKLLWKVSWVLAALKAEREGRLKRDLQVGRGLNSDAET